MVVGRSRGRSPPPPGRRRDVGRRDLANGVGGAGQGRSRRGPGVRGGEGGTVTRAARTPAEAGGRGGGYKTRGGARAAAEGAKLWPGAQRALYGDAGAGPPGCVEKRARSSEPVVPPSIPEPEQRAPGPARSVRRASGGGDVLHPAASPLPTHPRPRPPPLLPRPAAARRRPQPRSSL